MKSPRRGTGWVERRFCVAECGSSVRTELVAGAAPFLVMACLLAAVFVAQLAWG